MSRAYPSALAEDPYEIGVDHQPDATEWATVRNGLAAEATGDWLCFLDADDELAPGFLTAMEHAWGALLASFWGGPVILVPAVEYVRADGMSDPPAIPNGGLARWPDINIAVCASLIPRALFLELGGFRAADIPYDDYSLWLRAERAGARLVEVPQAVYRAYVCEDSAMRDPATKRQRADLHMRLLREHREWQKANA